MTVLGRRHVLAAGMVLAAVPSISHAQAVYLGAVCGRVEFPRNAPTASYSNVAKKLAKHLTILNRPLNPASCNKSECLQCFFDSQGIAWLVRCCETVMSNS